MESLQHAKFFGAELAGRFLPMNNGFGGTQVVALVLIIIMVAAVLHPASADAEEHASGIANRPHGPAAKDDDLPLPTDVPVQWCELPDRRHALLVYLEPMDARPAGNPYP